MTPEQKKTIEENFEVIKIEIEKLKTEVDKLKQRPLYRNINPIFKNERIKELNKTLESLVLYAIENKDAVAVFITKTAESLFYYYNEGVPSEKET